MTPRRVSPETAAKWRRRAQAQGITREHFERSYKKRGIEPIQRVVKRKEKGPSESTIRRWERRARARGVKPDEYRDMIQQAPFWQVQGAIEAKEQSHEARRAGKLNPRYYIDRYLEMIGGEPPWWTTSMNYYG